MGSRQVGVPGGRVPGGIGWRAGDSLTVVGKVARMTCMDVMRVGQKAMRTVVDTCELQALYSSFLLYHDHDYFAQVAVDFGLRYHTGVSLAGREDDWVATRRWQNRVIDQRRDKTHASTGLIGAGQAIVQCPGSPQLRQAGSVLPRPLEELAIPGYRISSRAARTPLTVYSRLD